jgi:hypothetical protein
MGKSPFDIIEILGDRPFYVCPQNSLKNPDGTCVSGMIPYKFDPDADNLNSRNDWIKKYCSH